MRFAETLGEIGEATTPFLLEALADRTNVVLRRAAAKTLTIIADPKAVPVLLNAFLDDEDTVVNGSAAGALARTGEAAVPALLDILASSEHSESTKAHASWALAFMGSEAIAYLYPAMQSDSVDVRCAVVGAIAQVGQEIADEQACNLLVAALTDGAAAIRTEAAAALGQVNGANLAGVDLRAADLTDIEFEQIESIAGADFSQVQGLSAEKRSHLVNHSAAELDTWNSFTRHTTRESSNSHYESKLVKRLI